MINKFVLLFLIFSIAAPQISAQTNPAPLSLASTMKQMATVLKTISAQVNMPAKNIESAKLADEYVKLTLSSKNYSPDPSRQSQYIGLIEDAAKLGEQLSDAFKKDDNTLANKILLQINDVRKQGHIEFK